MAHILSKVDVVFLFKAFAVSCSVVALYAVVVNNTIVYSLVHKRGTIGFLC